jgi:aryl-alcohol dehydrogenase-like predicted oxidoreductase
MPKSTPPLSDVIPPLIFGTATFNTQYNKDPFSLPTKELVHAALSHGICGFDTSPYYGPSEKILGAALAAPYKDTGRPFPRGEYTLITKVGRIAGDKFDYSKEWVRKSVHRSLHRLKTDQLDLVYCHDVEFVSKEEVLEAVTELRRLRDEDGVLRYVGICGYPVDVLAETAEYILQETGESVDAVQSYGNYTVQNTQLKKYIKRFVDAGVDVVPNSSLLGMGLLRTEGVPIGGMGDWHPAPNGLREACRAAANYVTKEGESLEAIATRWALEHWLLDGTDVGTHILGTGKKVHDEGKNGRIGVSVIGVSQMKELDEAVGLWRSVLDEVEEGVHAKERETSWERTRRVQCVVEGLRTVLGEEWVDYAWGSPGEGFVRKEVTDEDRDVE